MLHKYISQPARASNAWHYGVIGLALLPPLYLIALVLTQTVDVPFADQWALVPLLVHMEQGRLSFGELWAQHNEHRLLFPRLVMLALARVSGWNTHVEMLANVALASGILGMLVWQARTTARLTRTRWYWLLPVLSLAVFSLNQAENWWGGWNIQIFLNVLAAVSSIVLLTRPGRTWGTFALAVCCGVVATYSYSTGLLIWWVGALLLLLQPGLRAMRGALRLGLWIVAGGLATAAFFHNYMWTAQTTSLGDLLAHPLRYLFYVATYLGAPPTRSAIEYVFGVLTGDTQAICNLGDSDLCSYVNNGAIVAGIAGVVLLVALLLMLARQYTLVLVLPHLGLSLYAISTALLTSLGRASLGNHQALAQRYATNASLLWFAVVLLLWLWAQPGWRRPLATVTSRGSVLLFALLMLLCTLQGMDHFRAQYAFLAPARAELFKLHDDALLTRLYFDPAVVRRDAKLLHQYHLAVFR